MLGQSGVGGFARLAYVGRSPIGDRTLVLARDEPALTLKQAGDEPCGCLLRVRLREVLLPLVLYPLLAPLLIAGVKVTALAQVPDVNKEAVSSWLLLMFAFDVLVVIMSPWLHARVVDPVRTIAL